MKEKLTCKKCNKTWSRVVSRGRKPHFCSSCIKQEAKQSAISIKKVSVKYTRIHTAESSKSVSLKTINKKESDKSPIKGPSHWQCPSCLVSVSININIYDVPTHFCKKRLNKNFPLEKVPKIVKTS